MKRREKLEKEEVMVIRIRARPYVVSPHAMSPHLARHPSCIARILNACIPTRLITSG